AKIMASQPRLHQIAKMHYGLELNQVEFGIDSRPALIGMKYADAQGKGHAYHKRVFESYWLEGENIGDLETLANIAENIGLDREKFLAALNAAQYENQVDADVLQANQYQLR